MNNKYINRSKISEAKFRELIKCFSLDLDALQISALTGLNRNTVNRYLKLIRQRIADYCDSLSPFIGEIELDESYFGAHRVRGKRGRKVYTEIVPDCKSKTLQDIVRGKISVESVIHTDGWRGYDGLVDIGYDRHFRVNHGNNEFANKVSHINGIESFWSYAKIRLVKFRGIKKDSFYLHLKECEFRFNHRSDNLSMLKFIRNNPL